VDGNPYTVGDSSSEAIAGFSRRHRRLGIANSTRYQKGEPALPAATPVTRELPIPGDRHTATTRLKSAFALEKAVEGTAGRAATDSDLDEPTQSRGLEREISGKEISSLGG